MPRRSDKPADEEPIRNLNSEALEIALQVAKLLKAEIPDEIEIMRKIIIKIMIIMVIIVIKELQINI